MNQEAAIKSASTNEYEEYLRTEWRPETFQTEWLLRRELARCGLVITTQLAGSNPLTPFLLIEAQRRELDKGRSAPMPSAGEDGAKK